jgi:ribosome-associated protein
VSKVTEQDSRDWALIAARAASDKKGSQIVVQYVHDAIKITDYFVIVTGMNNRQVDAIGDAVEEALREQVGVKPLGREGEDELTWVLLDYGNIVVHIFQPETRDFYRLETLWNDAPTLDLAAEGILEEPAE